MLYQERIISHENQTSSLASQNQVITSNFEAAKQINSMKKGSVKRKHKVYPPTRVLFVRNLPHDASENDLKRVFETYGPVEKALIMIQKTHGFVQFKNLEDAKKCLGDLCLDIMINHDSSNPERSKPQRIYLNDSELLISASHRSEITDEKTEQSSNLSPVLLVTITNVKFPVNADVLFSVFNKYGDVLRVIIFDK